MKNIKIPLVRVVFVFVALLAVNVVFLKTYVQANNVKIEQYKLAAREAASQAKAAQAEAVLAQKEAER